MKFAPDDLQGPAGSESVFLQEKGSSPASRSPGDNRQLLREEGVCQAGLDSFLVLKLLMSLEPP